MTNEIKEIINNLIEYRKSDYKCKQPEDCLTIEDVWLLLNYITNLQNEIFDLKDTIQNKNDCIGAYECIIEDRDKRIDKAVEYIEDIIERFNKINDKELISNRLVDIECIEQLLDILRGDE